MGGGVGASITPKVPAAPPPLQPWSTSRPKPARGAGVITCGRDRLSKLSHPSPLSRPEARRPPIAARHLPASRSGLGRAPFPRFIGPAPAEARVPWRQTSFTAATSTASSIHLGSAEPHRLLLRPHQPRRVRTCRQVGGAMWRRSRQRAERTVRQVAAEVGRRRHIADRVRGDSVPWKRHAKSPGLELIDLYGAGRAAGRSL